VTSIAKRENKTSTVPLSQQSKTLLGIRQCYNASCRQNITNDNEKMNNCNATGKFRVLEANV